jgi:hypothetical protein
MRSCAPSSDNPSGSQGDLPSHNPKMVEKRSTGRLMVLPVRMEAGVVVRLDEVWRRLGHKSRTEVFHKALVTYFLSAGETEVAALLDAGPHSSSASAGR